ncbi:MAG: hypothetical protein WCP79_06025 [Bacillota bacterium]
MKKLTVLLLCLALIMSTCGVFAATTAQQQAPAAPAAAPTSTTNNIEIFNLGPAFMPTFSGNVDIQGMPYTSFSRWSYIPSQPIGGLVDNLLARQFGLALNINLDGSITTNTAYHLNGYAYDNYYQPAIQDTDYQFQPVLQGSGYLYNIAPYLGFINYQAGRMAYAPGAGLLLYSNMDGVQLNLDFGQLQVNVYGGNDTTQTMQTFVVPGAPGMSTAILQAQDSDPYSGWAYGPGTVATYSNYNLGARVVAIDASYNFNNPITIKAGFSDIFAANNGSNTYMSGTVDRGAVGPIEYITRLTMADVGVFYDDGTWSGRVRGGYSPSNDLAQYKTALGDNLVMLGMDAKVQYGRYDVSVPGSYDVAAVFSKVGPLAGFSPDAPTIANSGTGCRVYGDYVLDTNFKANVGYTYILGLQPTTVDQAHAKSGYDTSSIVNLGLTYSF